MTAFLIYVFSLFSLGTPSEEMNQEKMTTYYFIRHAEKDTSDPQDKDPHLTEAGLQRAHKWAEVFKEVEFDVIFSSDFNRTRKTAQIIADSQEKSVEFYDPKKLNDEEFQKRSAGKTVLVIGHSNTNPHFVNLLIGEKKYQDISEEESGSLFIVHAFPSGTKTSEVLYIN
ncbi:MAG TPA: phosphoglycerate mutase [Salinimicrobium catena]|uniref:Phosphoglycerate mutase n=1 Tax=Salinimicrobium catena TaxID=390640 RepID=A0A7C2M5Q1_9FLAO|nr:phosphoglycerate mutase [Salinimicrobium catena]